MDAAIAAAVRAEHGYRHTAIIHSRNMDNVTKMARAMNTTLFVSNGPCVAGSGQRRPGISELQHRDAHGGRRDHAADIYA